MPRYRKRQKRRESEQSLLEATVDYVSQRYALGRAKDGETYSLRYDGIEGLLPNDGITIQPKRKAANGKVARVIGIARKSQRSVVAQVCSAGNPQMAHLEIVGLPGIGRIGFDNSRQPLSSGQFVQAAIAPESKTKDRTGWRLKRIISVLEDPSSLANAVAYSRHGIDGEPAKELEREAGGMPESVSDLDIAGRADLRELPFVTIDPKGAKDHDDAVYCETDGSGWRLFVAIADVGHFVKAGSALDAAAFARGCSVYAVRSVVPMIPKRLSGDLCSLKAQEDRLAIVCEARIDADGRVVESGFCEAVIRSAVRLTYAQADSDAEVAALRGPVRESLAQLKRFHAATLQARAKREALDLDIPAPALIFDKSGCVTDVAKSESTRMHSLIEEAMLVANVCAAEFIERHYPSAAMFRAHDAPSGEAAMRIGGLLESFGISFPANRAVEIADYLSVNEQAADRPELLGALQSHLLRSLATAVYSEIPRPHFALNFPLYTHFTSPIRRYPDLVVHRMIKAVIASETADGVSPDRLKDVARQCSYLERKAEACSREAMRWLTVEYMDSRHGESFEGVIVEIREFGLFVQIDSPFVTGMAPVATLGSDYFRYDERTKRLIGDRSGRVFSIGMPVRVRVVDTDTELGFIDLEVQSAATQAPRRRRRRSR